MVDAAGARGGPRGRARGRRSDVRWQAGRMTRDEKIARVRALREEGYHWEEIARIVGLARSTAHALYADPTGDKARERKRRYERACVGCGKTINPQGIREDTIRCRTCQGAHERALTRRWII